MSAAPGAGTAPITRLKDLEIPTTEEVFDKPYPPAPPIQPAWDAEFSIAAEIADREIARLLVNCCLFDPPIEESEIAAYARHFGISLRQAELELRRERDED
jgi:hypothetical protein